MLDYKNGKLKGEIMKRFLKAAASWSVPTKLIFHPGCCLIVMSIHPRQHLNELVIS